MKYDRLNVGFQLSQMVTITKKWISIFLRKWSNSVLQQWVTVTDTDFCPDSICMLVHKTESCFVHKMTTVSIYSKMKTIFTHQYDYQDLAYTSSAEKMYLVCCLTACLWKSDRCQREARSYRICTDNALIPLKKIHVCAFMISILVTNPLN